MTLRALLNAGYLYTENYRMTHRYAKSDDATEREIDISNPDSICAPRTWSILSSCCPAILAQVVLPLFPLVIIHTKSIRTVGSSLCPGLPYKFRVSHQERNSFLSAPVLDLKCFCNLLPLNLRQSAPHIPHPTASIFPPVTYNALRLIHPPKSRFVRAEDVAQAVCTDSFLRTSAVASLPWNAIVSHHSIRCLYFIAIC